VLPLDLRAPLVAYFQTELENYKQKSRKWIFIIVISRVLWWYKLSRNEFWVVLSKTSFLVVVTRASCHYELTVFILVKPLLKAIVVALNSMVYEVCCLLSDLFMHLLMLMQFMYHLVHNNIIFT
jgi:hypothetical protein